MEKPTQLQDKDKDQDQNEQQQQQQPQQQKKAVSPADLHTVAISTEWQHMRRVFLSALYQQASTRVELFQRGQRLNASTIVAARSVPPKAARRKSSLVASGRLPRAGKNHVGEDEKDMPSEKVLNGVKLERELDALLRIFAVGSEENSAETATPSSEKLREAIEAQRQDSTQEEKLVAQLRLNRAALKSLKAQIDTDRRAGEVNRAQLDERHATLRHNLANVRRVNELELSLVERWEENRCTQAAIVCSNEERALQQQLMSLLQRIDGEERIVREVGTYRTRQQAELRERIAAWQQRFADELAAMEAQTLDKERRCVELRKMHERHRDTYEQRAQFVVDYMAERAEAQRLYEQQMHRVDCAVRIQAWWRGVMVRRGLGPFRKKSKKGKKTKAKVK